MLKNTVIVKKCKSHRVGIGIFSGLMVIAVTICVLSLRTAAAALLYVPVLMLAAPMTLYYLTWRIQLREKEIVKRVFFLKTKKYPYAQLRDVVKRYYVSDRDVRICMYFTDGTKMAFCMGDDNAAQAVKQLQRHGSIKVIA